MQKYSKLSLILFVSLCTGFAFIVALIIYINDPLEIWHKSFFRKKPAYAHARLSARAFIRDYDFNSVIIGNSHSENTSAKKAGEILGGRFFNLSISGSTMAEKSLITKYLLKHKHIDKIVYIVDSHYFNLDKNAPGYALETYSFLYDDNNFNDYRIYLNDKYIQCALSFRKISSCVEVCNPDRPYSWDDKAFHISRFGGFEKWLDNKEHNQVKDVLQTILSTPLEVNHNTVDDKYEEKLHDYFDEYFFKVVKENPNVKFYIVVPPVSNLQFAVWIRNNPAFEKYKLMLKYLVNEGAKYQNMEVYAFDNLDSIGKIEDFKDLTHFRTWINYFILNSIAQNNHQITPDNIDKYFKDVYNKALKEDFAGYYYKIKSTMKTPV